MSVRVDRKVCVCVCEREGEVGKTKWSVGGLKRVGDAIKWVRSAFNCLTEDLGGTVVRLLQRCQKHWPLTAPNTVCTGLDEDRLVSGFPPDAKSWNNADGSAGTALMG